MAAQVLVVGAGPVGLTLAVSLLRLGVAVRIVDKAPAPSDKSKALVVWPRTLELLDIAGFAAPFVATGLRATVARVSAGKRTLARVELGGARTDFPYALMIPQDETERLLGAELTRLGGAVERSVELVSFAPDEAGVTTELRHGDGRAETLRVAWLGGCDGAHSAVRHGLNLSFIGDTMPSTWLLADVHFSGDLPVEVLISWSPEGTLAVFPIAAGRIRVIADIAGDGRTDAPTLQEIAALFEQRGPGGVSLHDPVWLSTFRINERKVADYRVGRVFLAGDAAHVHSPAGGQGMNTGMQDAINLAWKLALVARGASPVLLDSYSPERSGIGELVLARAGRMTRVALLRNPLLRAVRNEAAQLAGRLPAFVHAMAAQLMELDLAYPHSPLNGPAAGRGAARPGTRIALPGLAALLRDGRFAVLNGAVLPERYAAVAVNATLPGLPPGVIHVVRPDGYLAMSATDDAGVHGFLAGLWEGSNEES